MRGRLQREALSLLIDASVVWWAWQATYLFRLGFDRWLSARAPYDPWVALGVVIAYLLAFKAYGQTRGVWRFTGFGDIQRLALACATAGLACGLLISPLLGLAKVPRAVLALHPLVALMGVCGARLLYRMVHEHLQARSGRRRQPQRPALVIGAGEAAKRLAAGVQGQGWALLGLLDDDPGKLGATLAGLPVLGRIADIAAVAQRTGATHLILALPSVRGAARRRIIELVAETGLPLLTVPSADELREGAEASRIRDIEPDDLLGREPVALDDGVLAEQVSAQVVLVTGAGGSIGSELCMQLARFAPQRIVLIDHAEYPLYRIDQRLRERHPGIDLHPVLLDIKDEAALTRLMEAQRPRIVFHAAAYKHVPLVEVGNALAALSNNALGTWATAQAAAKAGADRFVLISTDKAVNPANVMGATKRAAERLISALARLYPATRFIAVRFGNVLGSSGSVIPRFKEQIARGGPITVTHPDIIRYFMTIPEACRLVLQAGAIGQSGEVLVLDMGQPVRIVDLARSMIRLSGHREEEIEIAFTGLRPGEKLYEELLADAETTLPTPVPALRRARLQATDEPQQAASWVERARALNGEGDAVRRHLQELVPEFQAVSRTEAGRSADARSAEAR